MDPITVSYRKGSVLVILVAAVVFLALSLLVLTLPNPKPSFQGTLAAWVCIPLSIIAGAFAFSRLRSNEPALIINEKGITDNASGLAVGFVPWDDITGAGIAAYRKKQFLGITVRNPEQYLAKAGRLKGMLMKANSSKLGYVVNIPQVALPVSVETLLTDINEYRHHLEQRRNA